MSSPSSAPPDPFEALAGGSAAFVTSGIGRFSASALDRSALVLEAQAPAKVTMPIDAITRNPATHMPSSSMTRAPKSNVRRRGSFVTIGPVSRRDASLKPRASVSVAGGIWLHSCDERGRKRVCSRSRCASLHGSSSIPDWNPYRRGAAFDVRARLPRHKRGHRARRLFARTTGLRKRPQRQLEKSPRGGVQSRLDRNVGGAGSRTRRAIGSQLLRSPVSRSETDLICVSRTGRFTTLDANSVIPWRVTEIFRTLGLAAERKS